MAWLLITFPVFRWLPRRKLLPNARILLSRCKFHVLPSIITHTISSRFQHAPSLADAFASITDSISNRVTIQPPARPNSASRSPAASNLAKPLPQAASPALLLLPSLRHHHPLRSLPLILPWSLSHQRPLRPLPPPKLPWLLLHRRRQLRYTILLHPTQPARHRRLFLPLADRLQVWLPLLVERMRSVLRLKEELWVSL